MKSCMVTAFVVSAISCCGSFGQQLGWSITPATTNYMVEEPVLLKLVIYNDSATTLQVPLGRDAVGALRFGTNENDLRTNSMLRFGGIIKASSLRLEPGGSYKDTIILDEWIRLPPGGAYGALRKQCGAPRDAFCAHDPAPRSSGTQRQNHAAH